MGKGDRKSKRGKLFAGTYGNSRPRKPATTTATETKKDTK